MNTIIVKTNDATQTVNQVEVVTQDGIPTVIKATDKVNYEFHDTAINRAPNHIITKRVENDLHVSFEENGEDSDLIIEGFYDNPDNALVGIAEDGEYYYYIPDTGETYDYVTQLAVGDVEGQALGGEEYMAAAIPWWIPAAAGLGLVGLIAGRDSDDDNDFNDDKVAPEATDDNESGTSGSPVVVDVVGNDTDAEDDLDPTSVKLLDPTDGSEVTTLTIPGEGEWVVDPTTGEVTFTPETGFTGDPTPVDYVVSDVTGEKSDPATITIDYPQTAPIAENDRGVGPLNTAVSVDILANDSDPEDDLDPTSVMLIDPITGDEVSTVTVAGEGEWVVDPDTGVVTFTPETGFTDDPTPVDYVVSDMTGEKSNPATIVVDYPPAAPVAVDEVQTGTPGDPVVVDVLGNDTDLDGDLDPTSVKLLDPTDGSEVTTLTIPGEGEWVVDPTTGEVTFTPETGFTGDPTPVDYVVSDTTGLTSEPATVTIDYPQTAPVAVDDNESGTSGSPVVVDVVGNDTDAEDDLDPTSVKLLDPTDGSEVTTLTIPGEGEWVVDPTTGEVTFTPETGFTGDPTPISYTVDDTTGETSNEATVTIDYPQTAPVAVDDSESGTSGNPVVVDVVGNDTDAEDDLDPTSVIITASPAGGTIAADGKSVDVPGEGSWSVDPNTGEITFTPETGFTGDPTPISYTVDDTTGETSNEATVTIDYPQTAPVAVDDSEPGTSGNPVVVDVVGNDTDAEDDLDPTSVIITASPAGGTIAADGKVSYAEETVEINLVN